ncbi:LutC/YkgG family protein [Haladaptatus sp. NG-SE-30]
MATDTVTAFRESLRELGVEFTRTTPTGAEDALAECVVEPAVGTPLPFDGVSLPESVTLDPTLAELERAETGITPATFAIADYGTVVVQPTDAGEDSVSLHPDRHVAVVAESDVVPGMTAAFDRLVTIAEAGGSAIFATGPSATADMGALVQGVHGPKEVHVLLVSDR